VYERILENATDSGIGPNGLPYSAWTPNKKLSALLLFRFGGCLSAGFSPPITFNHTIGVFPPKGKGAPDTPHAPHPSSTRPLGCRNCDPKLMAAAHDYCIKRSVAKHASPIQSGFVYSRQLCQNVVDLDILARAYSTLNSKWACYTLYDIACAFGSIDHD